MFSWLRNFFRPKSGQSEEEEFEEFARARQEALENVLGEIDTSYHAPIPLFLGGSADVVVFRKYVPGYTYATLDLIGDDSQIKNQLGNYELMICTRNEAEWAANIIGVLARYTFEAKVRPGETMDFDPYFPDGSTVRKLLFCVPELEQTTFKVLGRKCGLLLCVGITPRELEVSRRESSEVVLTKLKESGVFPYTIHDRRSVV